MICFLLHYYTHIHIHIHAHERTRTRTCTRTRTRTRTHSNNQSFSQTIFIPTCHQIYQKQISSNISKKNRTLKKKSKKKSYLDYAHQRLLVTIKVFQTQTWCQFHQVSFHICFQNKFHTNFIKVHLIFVSKTNLLPLYRQRLLVTSDNQNRTPLPKHTRTHKHTHLCRQKDGCGQKMYGGVRPSHFVYAWMRGMRVHRQT